ncbi:hypothetical protein CEXT_379101 [Caerostris extrusa]|uniref:Uncharacterized protein n=1 Tax=Caerostris extrusa TaxID=172846 RepID=A0AAV4MNF8_CAEEX|nr:hypothetical protein CEXT_379101 [Caerostris extrusa]
MKETYHAPFYAINSFPGVIRDPLLLVPPTNSVSFFATLESIKVEFSGLFLWYLMHCVRSGPPPHPMVISSHHTCICTELADELGSWNMCSGMQ